MANARKLDLANSVFPYMGSPTLTNFVLNQSTDAAEALFQVPSGFAGAIERIFIRQGVVTGTSPTYRVSVQGQSSAAVPDGAIKGAGAGSFVDVTPVAGGDGTGYWLTLGAPYTPAAGEYLSVVIAYQSGTIDAGNCCSFTTAALYSGSVGVGGVFVGIQNDNGSRTKSTTGTPVISYGAAATCHGWPVHAIGTTATVSPNEIGNKFAFPAGWGSTFQLLGARIIASGAGAGGTSTIKLYDTDLTTVIQSVVFDHDYPQTGTNKVWYVYFANATLADLLFGSTYRLTVSPDGAQSFTPVYFDVLNAADMDAYFLGQSCFASSKSGGSFADTVTRRYGIAPILADWTEPAGGGGGTIFPGMVVR